MSEEQDRQYLDDVPKDIQDMIYDGRHAEAIQLLMDQQGLQKIRAGMEVARIATRMSQAFPDADQSPSSGPAMTAKQQSVVSWAIISLVFLAGAGFTGIGIHGLASGFQSRSWPSTESRIKQSKVERRTHRSGVDRTTAYFAVVTYEFTVHGASYMGDRVSSSDVGRDSKFAERIVDRYPKGSITKVYYNPENPSECLLEPGVQGKAFIAPSIGLFLLLLGGVFLAAQISASRDERRSAEHPDSTDC